MSLRNLSLEDFKEHGIGPFLYNFVEEIEFRSLTYVTK